MTIYAKAPFKHVTEFNNLPISDLFNTPEFVEAVNSASTGGGGLSGSNYVYVAADGTDTENAVALQAAYTKAASLVSSSSTWVSFGILGTFDLGGGDYEIGFSNPTDSDFFVVGNTYNIKINGTEYLGTVYYSAYGLTDFTTNAPAGLTVTSFEALDITVKRATVIAAPGYYNFAGSAFVVDQEYVDIVSLDGNRSIVFNGGIDNTAALVITADDVYIKGIDVEGKTITTGSTQTKNILENCKALGTFSFGEVLSVGTFINCEGGYQSFGANGNASGTYIDCKGGDSSFGGVYTASGTFTRCTAGNGSFGYTASGTFIDCVGGGLSFGSSGYAPGTFKNCVAGVESFGGGYGIGTAAGTFINCEAGNASFGGSTLNGYLYYCRLTSGTFKVVSGSGKVLYGIDGNNDPNNQGFTAQNIV